ncbi:MULTISPECIES: lysophospholipid acyltransferase family protein [Streptomyces]|uniref:lysophospholipid acyltransferase family protein n=1 Tax=Streptomyces TaxID=1883 RepID=UPI0006FE7A26|nr:MULTISPECIES: lysophospholipid acyltransferase family protein [unclassified Streptomyces]KQX91504.1 acyltransferase [Streptomyces sp. Root1319]KQZ20062.1 acyltransferase [Streptomyces sp. Root55]MDX3061448.1 lysophospholipid acyltransferase family protein [Streptomyces sp. ND04-05B]WRY80298.1 1-acyl-sn-glycerol-3-phosphate acyltransferase [Streptomyces clavifer]
MLSRLAESLVPVVGRLTVTTDSDADLAEGSIIAANHSSLADPAVVLAALRRLGVEPVVLAAAGLWRIPVLGRALARDGHIPVYRRDARARDALDGAAEALARGRLVLIYGEGGIPLRRDAGEAAPEAFRSGLARLVDRTGAPVIPLGQAGSRRITSGSVTKQIAGLCTAPLRRPGLHVHVGAPVVLTGDVPNRTLHARAAVTDAWRKAAERLAQRIALAA